MSDTQATMMTTASTAAILKNVSQMAPSVRTPI